MSWDLHIERPSASGSISESGPPLGKLSDVRESVEKYFPGGTWDGRGSVECHATHGSVRFDFAGNPVEYVSVEAHPTSDSLGLVLRAMARESGWRVIDYGTGDLLDLQYPRSAKAIQKIQRDATERQTNPSSRTGSKPRLPSVKSKIPLTDAEFDQLLSLCVLAEGETSYDVFCEIPQFVLSNEHDEEDLGAIPECGNEEILLPDGGRLSVLWLDPAMKRRGESLMRRFYERTQRATANLSRGFVTLQDGSKFRASDCFLVWRAMGRGRRA